MTKKEAIKVIKANYPSGGYEDLRQALDMAIKSLQKQKQKVVGEWQQSNIWYIYKCSLCGERNMIQSNYCPHCGAQMESIDESNGFED